MAPSDDPLVGRRAARDGATVGREVIDVEELRIDIDSRSASVDGDEVVLTVMEYDLLVALATRRERVQSRGALLRGAWDRSETTRPRIVDAYVRRLRSKLRSAGRFIQSVRGFGYRFSEIPDKDEPAWSHIRVYRSREPATVARAVSPRTPAGVAKLDMFDDIARVQHTIAVVLRTLSTLPRTSDVIYLIERADRLLADTVNWRDSLPSPDEREEVVRAALSIHLSALRLGPP